MSRDDVLNKADSLVKKHTDLLWKLKFTSNLDPKCKFYIQCLELLSEDIDELLKELKQYDNMQTNETLKYSGGRL